LLRAPIPAVTFDAASATVMAVTSGGGYWIPESLCDCET
jgi:hypothetical protein